VRDRGKTQNWGEGGASTTHVLKFIILNKCTFFKNYMTVCISMFNVIEFHEGHHEKYILVCSITIMPSGIWKKNKSIFHILIFSPSSELKAQVNFSCVEVYIFNFSRTTGPNLTKFWTNRSLVKGIQSYSSEGQPPPRGDNGKRVENPHW
jgi:hypothetical protein